MSVSGMSTLAMRIRAEAQKLGFFKTGIAPIGELPYQDYFDAWLKEGLHGEMRYLERQAPKRRDPGRILENARTLIVTALNYYSDQGFANAPLHGKISRYALGADYHDGVRDRLERLLAYIQRQVPSAQGRCYVDTGPIMEKVWGAQSSLGWMGKNTSLIARERGSWFFLGVILLDKELDYDRKEKDFCGRCNRCIQACPTRAIIEPYILDARLCISYLTIEFRGIIPRELRSYIGNRIYGCDDCQEACPWNRFAKNSLAKDLTPRAENQMPNLISLAGITAEEFDVRFADSPIQRVSRDGFVRNVVIALGNSGSIESVPALEKAIRDESPVVRAHAAWALGQLPFTNARRILKQAQLEEVNSDACEEIAVALNR